MQNGKQPHILNASSNLMGICFLIITGLKLTRAGVVTLTDEISIGACLAFMCSCILSYMSLRGGKRAGQYEHGADYLFLSGILLLFCAITLFATTNI